MNFSDIFKKDFIASYTSENISVPHIAAVLFITAVIACYIFVVYRLITKKTFYPFHKYFSPYPTIFKIYIFMLYQYMK